MGGKQLTCYPKITYAHRNHGSPETAFDEKFLQSGLSRPIASYPAQMHIR